MAGIGEGLVVVAFCGSCTFLTSVSLSAIATNGAMKVIMVLGSWILLVDECLQRDFQRYPVQLLM